MKIVNLVEDTKGTDCLNEHGLSFYIETEKHKILADCGATDMFLYNARLLGIDLTQVDTCVLSHGHYDHSGGLPAFAAINPDADIYLKETAGGEYYHISPQGERYIGIKKEILKLPKVQYVQQSMELDEELSLMTGFEGKRSPAWSNQELKEKIVSGYVQDAFVHEQCLVITQGGCRVLLSGCAHNGILSILDSYYEQYAAYPQFVISGFHMMKKSDYTQEEAEYIRETARELLDTGAVFYTGHCTGQAAYDLMKKIMGERLQRFYSGMVLPVE